MKRILVIEDEAPVRSNTVKILGYEGFDAIGAENGEVGVKLAKEMQPDLILCDIMMPVLDGYEVQTTLNQDPQTQHIPFIFLTAKSERADMRLAMNLGADDYLTKPFSRDELLETVFSRLDKQETLQQGFQQKLAKIRSNISTSLPAELFIPLQNIRGFLEQLKDQAELDLATNLQASLQESHHASLRLERLLQNFLFYALLEVASHDQEQAAALRGQARSDGADLVVAVAQEKAQEFQREADLRLQVEPASVAMLEANLAKIVEELLDNAFKFSAPEMPVLLEASAQNNSFVLRITDQGRGISADAIRAMDVSDRLSQRIQGQYGGGLGLAIAKRLAELHFGSLTIERQPMGTVVEVRLPLQGLVTPAADANLLGARE